LIKLPGQLWFMPDGLSYHPSGSHPKFVSHGSVVVPDPARQLALLMQRPKLSVHFHVSVELMFVLFAKSKYKHDAAAFACSVWTSGTSVANVSIKAVAMILIRCSIVASILKPPS
jgi:hypothetical protein